MIPLAALVLLAVGQPASEQPPLSAAAPPAAPQGPSQDIPSVTVTARRIQHIGEVTVTAPQPCPELQPDRYPASEDPRVIDSFPRQGASAPPGLIQVRVTFDAPMSCYAEVTTEGGDRDPCKPEGAWALPDRRSFLLQCRLAAGVTYAFKFNRDEGRGFVGLSGRDADPFVLRFATTSADPVASWPEAQAADPGPPGASVPRAYVTCADVKGSAASDDCRRQGFAKPTSPP